MGDSGNSLESVPIAGRDSTILGLGEVFALTAPSATDNMMHGFLVLGCLIAAFLALWLVCLVISTIANIVAYMLRAIFSPPIVAIALFILIIYLCNQ